MKSALHPLAAARRWNSSSFAAVAVHWLVHHLPSGASARNSYFE
jgi:hypothetical protein